MFELAQDLPGTLKRARQARRLSQLELSYRVGVSQRHVSFVETGRAKPSRQLLLGWLAELDVPLALRNAALLQAGFAPVYDARPLGDPGLAAADEAIRHLLAAHDPMPALVIDAGWNLLRLNRGGRWLAATLLPWSTELPLDPAVNLLDLFLHPEGFTRSLVNLREVGPAFLAHLREDAAAHPELAPRVEAYAELLRARLGAAALTASWGRPAPPVLTSRFATPHGELAFFSMFTTFGTPQNITLASLRVEHLFAADATTRAVLEASVFR
ncbi:MAG: helix-turn-helix transcriptional regulator [Thermoanaerobaculia bacterium]|nr:helix-turn-helix transcriptional regulator [Thermoanaerobaculia bacterium]